MTDDRRQHSGRVLRGRTRSSPVTAEARPLRVDAAANRDRVLAAAVRTILREGQQVASTRIAEEAGVGIATLYRRFPDRATLVDELQVRSYGLLAGVLDRAAAEGTTGLDRVARFLEGFWGVRDQILLPLHGAPPTTEPRVRDADRPVRAGIGAIVELGHADGSIRTDVTARAVVEFGALLVTGLPNVPDWDRSAADLRRIFLRGIAGG